MTTLPSEESSRSVWIDIGADPASRLPPHEPSFSRFTNDPETRH
jgi:hypothetical protein